MASSAGYSDLAAVFVHIKYSVDQSPLFSIDRCEALVAEGAPPGTVVARLPPVYYPGQCDVHIATVFFLTFSTHLCFKHEPTLVSAIGHFQLLDYGCGTAFRPTYDSPTLPFRSSAGR